MPCCVLGLLSRCFCGRIPPCKALPVADAGHSLHRLWALLLLFASVLCGQSLPGAGAQQRAPAHHHKAVAVHLICGDDWAGCVMGSRLHRPYERVARWQRFGNGIPNHRRFPFLCAALVLLFQVLSARETCEIRKKNAWLDGPSKE